MSSSDFGDRTLPPTERRRREARQRGEVARSGQLTSAVIFLTMSCCVWLMTPKSIVPITEFMRQGLTSVPSASLTLASTTELIRSAAAVFTAIVVPLGILFLTSGLITNLTQVGWLWVPSAIAPRFRGRQSDFGHSLSELFGTVLRLSVLGCVTGRFITTHQWPLHSLSLNEPQQMLVSMIQIAAEFSMQISASLILLGLVDYGYRFWRHEQGLKMTFEELRREQREDSVNPQIRDRQTRAERQGTRPVGPVEPLAPGS